MNGSGFGPQLTDRGALFRLWAPTASHVEVMLDRCYPMRRGADGIFSVEVPGARAGARYKFRIDDEIDVPDPASRFQPEDVSGPSEVIDHAAYRWRATDWRGRPWHEAVLIEAHVGTFTPQGTYRAMIDHLDHLADTGFTALELMPLADCPGCRNWGYDGVLWYAPDSAYGRPDELKALIDEAHLRGLMVFLDVVYNHFGPEGNYLGRYAPGFFSSAQTPWGNAIDYHAPNVRAFAIDNALCWLRDFRFDGLRLDAIHTIIEPREISILRDLSKAVGAFATHSGRKIHLVLENDANSASLLDPKIDPVAGRYRAQWNDDYHHAWHVLLTGETTGYYRDYPNPREAIVRTLGTGFAYQGETSLHRGGRRRGEASAHLPPVAFINFLQNHDQIGNRAMGDRLETVADATAVEAALAITLLAPMPPMMFMGEEWGATSPFPFFCDFKGDLADAIRQSRRREYAAAYQAYGDDVPDPFDETTFKLATLDWAERDTSSGRARLALVRNLLSIRRKEIMPQLADAAFGEAHVDGSNHLIARWRLGEETLTLQANLSAQTGNAVATDPPGRVIWGQRDDDLKPWGVVWMIGAR